MNTWHDDSFPELRPGPPWVMEEMMDVEPTLPVATAAADGSAAELAGAVRAAGEGGRPIVVTGCGTSEHAAQGIAVLLEGALGSPVEARQALEATNAPRGGGVCIGVSHEGSTAATIAALAAARRAGATTALVTAVPASAAARAADVVLATPVIDSSWCHTVGYVSPLLAGGLVAAELDGERLDTDRVGTWLGSLRHQAVDPVPFGGAERLIAAGAGVDAVTARELALKIAEGTHLPTAAYELENVLHGHLAAHDERSALVVTATGPAGAIASRRAEQVLAAAARIGLATATIASPAVAEALGTRPAVTVDPPAGMPDALGRLLGGALALQLLTVAIAHARDVNPDLLRREDERYREAAALGAKKTAAVFLDRT